MCIFASSTIEAFEAGESWDPLAEAMMFGDIIEANKDFVTQNNSGSIISKKNTTAIWEVTGGTANMRHVKKCSVES